MALLVVLLVLGAALRLVAVAHTGVHAPGAGSGDVRHAAGLVVGGSVYVVLVRWQVWRWLAALAALPGLLDVRVIAVESPPGGRYLALAALSAVVVAAVWRGWDRTTRWVWAGAGVFLLGLALLLRTPGARYRSVVLYDGLAHQVWWPLPVLGLLLAAAAAAGLGRADASPLRGPCAALVAGPIFFAMTDPVPGLSWHDAPMLVVWGPAAGALGLTALLRGRRGRATARPQCDAVDEAAVAGFHDRYGHPQLGPVTVVIAAYNEAEGLPDVLATLPRQVGGLDCDVVVVDDGSVDGTAAAVEAAGRAEDAPAGATSAAGPRIRVVACPTNRGQGAALRLGYRIAREHGARYVLTTDADGQYAVEDFPTVLAPLVDGRADFVTGSRILGAQHTHDRVRRTGVHVFAWIATVLSGRRLTDTSFGLRAMRAEATAAVTLNQPQYQSSELLLGMISHGYRVMEVPGTMHVRSAGASKKGRNLVYGSRYARVVLGTWWREGCLRPCADPGLRTARTRATTQESAGVAWEPMRADAVPLRDRARGWTPGPARRRVLEAVRGQALRSRVRVEAPFLVALVLGAVIRVLVLAAFTPGFVFSDGVLYLDYADHLTPSPDRPVGYSVLLRGLYAVSRTVEAVSVVQHVLGLLTAVVLYLLLRRWSVGPWVATLATLPVLLDGMELVLEHAPLSDVVFVLLMLLAVLALARRPLPRAATTLAAGLALGAAVVVRTVGEPGVLVGVLFVLLAVPTWRGRGRQVAALLAGVAVPVAAYAGWYHHVNGQWALTAGDGLALYQRSTSFVDCARLDVPTYERTLCPGDPVDQRGDPTDYAFHDPATVPRLDPPPGVSHDAALRDFATRAIEQQPGGYLRVVVRDLGYGFDLRREDRYGYDTADKWTFERYLHEPPTGYTGPAYTDHGGEQLAAHQPLAGDLSTYGRHVYLPGPAVALLGLLGLAGLVVRRRGAPPGLRPVIVLCLGLGFGLVVVPALTAQFVWRYQLPELTLVPAAAALAWTRLRGGAGAGPDPGANGGAEAPGTTTSDQSGTAATPSTD